MGAAQPQIRLEWRERRITGVTPAVHRTTLVAMTGLAGAVGLALPAVIYDWANVGHSALELPMAATSWVFGLSHFAQNGYQWGSIVVGMLLLLAYGIATAGVFAAVADRFLQLRRLPGLIGAGLACGFVGWMFFWYTLLPIARGGAPFHAAALSTLFVAPTWVFVVAFAVSGLMTSLVYAWMRRTG